MIPTIEISFDDEEKLLMDPYIRGVYEKTKQLTAGKHKYTVFYNSEIVSSNEINSYDEETVYVRYFPFGSTNNNHINTTNKGVFDSINNREEFVISATWVGELENFSKLYLKHTIDNWNPTNQYAKLKYIGGGIFGKKIKLQHTLILPYLLRYKIAFNDSWDDSVGFSDGSDVLMEIPEGTTEFIICVDTLKRRVKDSINSPKVFLELGEDSFMQATAFSTKISLCGDFNNWGTEDKEYELKQVNKNIYSLYRWFEAGTYSYTCAFDDILRHSGKHIKSFSISKRTPVLFIYNSNGNGKLLDSINSPKEVSSSLCYKLAMPSRELDKYAYNGNDLGMTYTQNSTTFKVWAPSACRVQLKRYATGTDDEKGARTIGTIDMKISEDNIWEVTLEGDLKNTYYNYLIGIGEDTFETVDIYAKAVGANGERAMVVDLEDTNPHNWQNDKRIRCKNQTDAIIWEINIKDFSFMENSGVSEENRGKYLAFTEKNTSLNDQNELKTCVSYLKELGITHVHLLPTFDFATVDEKISDHEAYNWGYDPQNFNVPEGSFSSDPYHGEVRINEFKRMVQSLHEENIGVIMDMVYNHTYYTETSNFNLTVPNYYYRKINGIFGNASGCGNETASERVMFRKYMIDSVMYWAKEYHIDGFRFDLMAIHDVDTMNAIRESLDTLENGKEILMYGEPWSALWPSPDKGIRMCSKDNTVYLNDRIAVFNDNIRDAIPGKIQHSVEYTGFIEGTPGQENSIKNGILSQNTLLGEDRYLYWSKTPTQTVNYVSAHDNFTLYDKLVLAIKGGNGYNYRYDDIVKMNKLSAALVITSQGIPFWQSGEEFARTKNGNSNSYNSPASMNALDWSRVQEYSDLVDYYKGLIQIRKHFDMLRDPSTKSLKSICFSENTGDCVCAYTIKDDEGNMLALGFNGNPYDVTVELKACDNGALPTSWNIIANGEKAGIQSIGHMDGNKLKIKANECIIIRN